MFASVDLPAPFGPMRACTSPSRTTRSTPRRMDAPSASAWRLRSSKRGVDTVTSLTAALNSDDLELPAPFDPLVEVRSLGADRRLGAVTGPDRHVVGEGAEDPLVDRRDDRREVGGVVIGVARTAGEECVAGEEHRRLFEREADAARRVAWRVQRAQSQVADLVDDVVIEQVVVARQHAGVFGAYPHVDARVAYLFDGADVVPVPVGLQDRGHAETTRDAK